MLVLVSSSSSLAYLLPGTRVPHAGCSAAVVRAARPLMQVTVPAPTVARKPAAAAAGASYLGSRKRDAAVNDETMRWYLSSIGSRRLLDNAEEIRLAMAVKELLRWNKVRNELMDDLERAPTRLEWATALGFSGTDESLLRFESQARPSPLTPILPPSLPLAPRDPPVPS